MAEDMAWTCSVLQHLQNHSRPDNFGLPQGVFQLNMPYLGGFDPVTFIVRIDGYHDGYRKHSTRDLGHAKKTPKSSPHRNVKRRGGGSILCFTLLG